MKDPDPEADELAPPPSVQRAGIELGGAPHPLVSLVCDYVTTPRVHWNDLLGNLRALGFQMVDVRVVWQWHLLEGELDFGHRDPQLDLPAFLQLAHQHNLLVCVRPGPRHDDVAGLDHDGIPSELALDPRCALGRHATSPLLGEAEPAPFPSLGCETFLERAEQWLEALGEVLVEHRHPRGPVVAVHLDSGRNVRAMVTRDEELHPDARALFRTFVKERYARPSVLRLAYGDPSLDFPRVAPPEPNEDAPLALELDYCRFQHHLVSAAFARFARALTRTCPGLRTTLPEFEAHARLQLRFLDVALRERPQARHWVTSQGSAVRDPQGGRLPLVDVMLERRPARGREHELLFQAMMALAAGARGLCLSPGNEAPGRAHALVNSKGEPTASMHHLAPLLPALERCQFHTLHLEPCVQIVLTERLLALGRVAEPQRGARGVSHSSVLAAEHTSEERASELVELQAVRETLELLEASLVRHGVPFRYANEWELDGALGTAPWTLLPCTRTLPDELLEVLQYGRRRGAPFSIGPYLPTGLAWTESDPEWPLVLGTTHETIEAQVASLVQRGQLPRREVAPEGVRALFHTRPDETGDALAVAFVLNPTARAVEAELACPGYSARDALTEVPVSSFAERLQLTVPPESVRMLELFATRGSAG